MANDKDTSTHSIHSLLEKSSVLAQGTFIGVIGRAATWHLEKSYYDAANPQNQRSYSDIYRRNFSAPRFGATSKLFFQAGLNQTVGKSLSGLGVVNYIERYHKDFTPVQKGLYNAVLSTPLETALTSRSEYNKINTFFKIEQGCHRPLYQPHYFSLAYGSMIAATAARVFWSTTVTFCSIYETARLAKQILPDSVPEPYIKGGAALISSFAVQPFIMPVMNYQTYIMLNSTKKTLLENTKDFVRTHTIKEMTKGCVGRGLNRGAYYGLTFFMSEALKKSSVTITDNKPKLNDDELTVAQMSCK